MVAKIIQENEDAGPLNSSEAEEDAGVGFDEVAEEAEGEVCDHENLEGVAGEKESMGTPCRGGGTAGARGVLRLRRGFASRNLCSAQDDKFIEERN